MTAATEFCNKAENSLVKSIVIFIIFLSFCGKAFSAAAELRHIQITTDIQKTNVILVFNKTIDYHLFTLVNPSRVVLDIADTHLKSLIPQRIDPQTGIKAIRINPTHDHRLRVVLDMALPVEAQTLHTKMILGGYRVQLELKAAPSIQSNHSNVQKPVLALKNGSQLNTYPYPKISSARLSEEPSSQKTLLRTPLRMTSLSRTRGAHPIVIAIDPGHGGKDPGATGPRNVKEKQVVLAIAQRLQRELNKTPGIRAILTRKGDYYLELRERMSIARKNKAEYFIAIHADAYKDPYASGASIFALSERGATSEAARWLAEKENYSELGGVDLSDKSRILRSVLIDLSQTVTISQSLEMGQNVLQSLGQLTRLHRGRVEQARFVVLKSPDIPSLLIETGFISNPNEEKRLNGSYYQQLLAEAISLGIKNYLSHHPKMTQWDRNS